MLWSQSIAPIKAEKYRFWNGTAFHHGNTPRQRSRRGSLSMNFAILCHKLGLTASRSCEAWVSGASEIACCRPWPIARARSIKARAWRVSRLNSCGSLWRAAAFSASTAALRSSFGSSGSSGRSKSVIAADRDERRLFSKRARRCLIGAACGLDVRSLLTCRRDAWGRSPNEWNGGVANLKPIPLRPSGSPQKHPYEEQAFPWSGLAPCAWACASDM